VGSRANRFPGFGLFPSPLSHPSSGLEGRGSECFVSGNRPFDRGVKSQDSASVDRSGWRTTRSLRPLRQALPSTARFAWRGGAKGIVASGGGVEHELGAVVVGDRTGGDGPVRVDHRQVGSGDSAS
jgi:hypothetical protein